MDITQVVAWRLFLVFIVVLNKKHGNKDVEY